MSQGKGQNSDRELPPRNHFPLPVKTPKKAPAVPQDHNKIQPRLLQGALQLEIEVLSPVFVGSGAYDLADGQLARAPVLRSGRPVIPGTSIKGMCRQAHEAITESKAPMDENRNGPSSSGTLFGCLGYQGKISFDDAVSEQEITLRLIRTSVAYQPQEPTGRRFYGPQPKGAKQPLHTPALAIPAGIRMYTHLRLRNVLPDELGTVLLALGVDRFQPKLGGGKYDRWGWVRFRPLVWRPRVAFGRSLAVQGDELMHFVKKNMSLAEPLLPPAGRKNLRQLSKKMQPPQTELGGTA